MRKLKNISILTQLLLLISVTTLIPVVILGFTTYNTYRNNLEISSILNNYDTLNQAKQNISYMINNVSSIINKYDNNDDIQILLETINSDEFEIIKITRTLEDELRLFQTTIGISDMNITLVGENNLLCSTSEHLPKISTNSMKQTYWYKDTKNNPNTINWFFFNRSYFNMDTTEPVIVATKDLYNYKTNKKYGTIIIEIYESYLYNLYKNVVDTDEYFIILDSSGNVISTSNRSAILSHNSELMHMDREDENLIYNYNYDNKQYTYIKQSSTMPDWDFIKLLSNEKIDNAVDKLQQQFILVYLFCLLIIVIGVYIVAIQINEPIRNLTKKIQNNYLHSSDFLKNTKNKSFSSALTSYELLIDEVDNTLDKLLEHNESRIDAELYALRMQINPHFLYNTLNSIKYLVWTNNIKLIEPTITTLVSLLKQTLQNPSEFITLREEINLITNYIYIQNIRTENSVKIKYNISKSDMNIKVPSLFLQPIVENSIFHGIEPLDKVGTISISTYTKENDLFIEIIDNGVGISKDKLTTILETVKEDDHIGFNSIGLYNVNQRLKIYYGEKYGLKISSQENIGTAVTIRIKGNGE